MPGLNRREVVAGAALAALRIDIAAAAKPLAGIPIIDPHMHLFDVTRPQGAPYALVDSPYYKGGVSLPRMYDKRARPAGIVGAMVMEVSNWVEDNLWILEQAQSDTMFVGVVGNLDPNKPEFAEYLDRFRKNPLFRGIRYSSLWGYDLRKQVDNPVFLDGLKRLAAADLTLDTINRGVDLLQAVVKIGDEVPDLRIVIDSLPAFEPKLEEWPEYTAVLKEMSGRPNIFAKMSWSNAVTPADIDHTANGRRVAGKYRDRLDLLTQTFGEDRVMFASNYPPVIGPVLQTIPQVVALTKAYYADKPRATAEKFFWKNSLLVYKWARRAADQPRLG